MSLYQDKGEQGHDACLFNPGRPQLPIVDYTLLVTQSNGINLLVHLITRQAALDLAKTLSPDAEYKIVPTHNPPLTDAINIIVKPSQLPYFIGKAKDEIAYKPTKTPNLYKLF
jgi:hypothetical protein